MIDHEALLAEIRAHVIGDVPDFATNDDAEGVDEALARSCATPALFSMLVEPSADNTVPSQKAQEIELEITLGLVFDNVQAASARLRGASGSMKLRQRVKRSMHWFAPATTGGSRRIRYAGEQFAGRIGTRSCRELKFRLKVYETYT